MNIQTEKLELIELLIGINDISILKSLKQFLISKQAEKSDRVISERLHNSIEKGLQQIATGQYNDHIEIRKIYEKWL